MNEKQKLTDEEIIEIRSYQTTGMIAKKLGVSKQTVDIRVNRSRARRGKQLVADFLSWYDSSESLPSKELIARARNFVKHGY